MPLDLTFELRNCLFQFFTNLKLKLLTQFPASNDKKMLLFMEDKTPLKLQKMNNRAYHTNYFINISGILFELKLVSKSNRIYTIIGAQVLSHQDRRYIQEP